MQRLHDARGFTLVEMLITLVIAAIVIALAVPSFRNYFVKRKVDGTAAELSIDIQFARSEAVSRNQPVRMSFGTNCYVIHVPVGSTADASCNVTGGTSLRRVQVEDVASVSLAASSPLTSLSFDTVRGEATLTPVADEGAIDVRSGVIATQIRALVSRFGRVRLCTPNASPGYDAC